MFIECLHKIFQGWNIFKSLGRKSNLQGQVIPVSEQNYNSLARYTNLALVFLCLWHSLLDQKICKV